MKLSVHIFEVGYCSDIGHAEKETEKRKQHDELNTLLKAAGFKVQYHSPITLGHTGTIPQSFYNTLRTAFSLDSTNAKRHCSKLAMHAAAWVDKLYTLRQCLQWGEAGQPQAIGHGHTNTQRRTNWEPGG